MEIVRNSTNPLSHPQPAPPQSYNYQKIIWSVVSTILFPIGLYRLACYGLGKYVVAPLILPSLNRDDIPEVLLPSNARQITLHTPDGIALNALQITNPNQQRWIVYAAPNYGLWQDNVGGYCNRSNTSNLNVLAINYRGTGGSDGRPTSFEDLYCDVDTAVQYLINQGVSPEHITIHGHSLGGAAALHIAQKRGLKVIAENTFSSTEAVAPSFIRPYANSSTVHSMLFPLFLFQQEGDMPPFVTALFSLKDALLSLPHLAIRVTYFFFSMFENLFQGHFEEAKKDLIEMGKTICIDTLLTITGLISLIASPFTNNINRLNGTLNAQFLTRSALAQFADSPKLPWLVQKVLCHTGWNADNTRAALALRNKVFVTHARADEIIPYETSLAKALQDSDHTENIIDLPQGSGHSDTLSLNDRRIHRFLNPGRRLGSS